MPLDAVTFAVPPPADVVGRLDVRLATAVPARFRSAGQGRPGGRRGLPGERGRRVLRPHLTDRVAGLLTLVRAVQRL